MTDAQPNREHPRSRGKALGADQLRPRAKRATDATGSPVVDGVPVMLRGSGRNISDIEPKRISTIQGVKVIGFADLIRGKLTVGSSEFRGVKRLGHVLDLVKAVPLKKDFTAKLPTKLRRPFNTLSDEVHGPRRTHTLSFYEKYAS
ncbi:MAG: hypothetical protein SFZ23_09375 [Planctomycetota bacterium]|nr:hypothetical protein [Planctomycetota bacterium]